MLIADVSESSISSIFILPMKMEWIEGSETSAISIVTPGNYPKENILHTEHGESLKSKKNNKFSGKKNKNSCRAWRSTCISLHFMYKTDVSKLITLQVDTVTDYSVGMTFVTFCLTWPTSVTTVCSSPLARIPLKEYTGGIRSRFTLSILYSLGFQHHNL